MHEESKNLKWTDDSPSSPGQYLYHYEHDDGTWVDGEMTVTPDMLPIEKDVMRTRWFGPIPEDDVIPKE